MSTRVSIQAKLPGTFYSRPAPGQPTFVEEGSALEVGMTVGLIEVMKSFNPVICESAGRFIRYLVEDDDAVMAGDALCDVEV